jgi:hypothetical protein
MPDEKLKKGEVGYDIQTRKRKRDMYNPPVPVGYFPLSGRPSGGPKTNPEKKGND